MSGKIPTKVVDNKMSAPSKKKKTIYRNFVISGVKYKRDVDRFYSKIEEFNKDTSVLKISGKKQLLIFQIFQSNRAKNCLLV
jgi:hypothetical protein